MASDIAAEGGSPPPRRRLKLGQERSARLEGRIVEADFYVRQLTWLEVALDLGGNAVELLHDLQRGGVEVGDIVATPMSLLLDAVRRRYWAEQGEPERPPLAPLGEHDDEVSTGPKHWYDPVRDGDVEAFSRRQKAEQARAAEAQAAWEEKARREAEAWRKRVEGEGEG